MLQLWTKWRSQGTRGLLSGRQIAFILYSRSKICDDQGQVICVDETLDAELEDDNLRTSDALWDETLIAKEDHELLESLSITGKCMGFAQLRNARSTKLLSTKQNGDEAS